MTFAPTHPISLARQHPPPTSHLSPPPPPPPPSPPSPQQSLPHYSERSGYQATPLPMTLTTSSYPIQSQLPLGWHSNIFPQYKPSPFSKFSKWYLSSYFPFLCHHHFLFLVLRLEKLEYKEVMTPGWREVEATPTDHTPKSTQDVEVSTIIRT